MRLGVFDPNEAQGGCRMVLRGPKAWTDRVEAVKATLLDEIAREIPPMFRDQVVWFVDKHDRITLDGFVVWWYPGKSGRKTRINLSESFT